ncbi:Orexin receptor type 2 [Takifugu flavidus]|uniref:Orexin receptor type 2 n=1 Tax=Takifugu flavidus TaxID=433684 RepID=A0A5C6PKB8_9TELE|nr:Orexin receptor type 2 [Takifugu flavidus]
MRTTIVYSMALRGRVLCLYWNIYSNTLHIHAARQEKKRHLERMSGVTGNLDCEECLSPAHVSNTTELNLHSAADEDEELLRYIWREYLHPKQYEWVLIVAYIIVFCVSLIGNSLGEFHCA